MLLWAEGLRTLRTREVYAYLLLPALLAVPLLIAGSALIWSLQEAPLVALPAEAEVAGFSLTELSTALEAQKVRSVALADPGAALREKEAEAAVIAVAPGPGNRGAAAGEEPVEATPRARAPDPRWTLRVAGDTALIPKIRRAATQVGDASLSTRVREAGGDPAADLWVAGIAQLPAENVDRNIRISRMIVAYLVFAVGLFGVMMVVGSITAERTEGLMESLAATASPPALWLLARLLSVTLLQCLAVTALFVSVNLVLGGNGAALPWPDWLGLRVFAALALLNSLFLVIAMVAADARMGISAGAYALMGAGLLLGWGTLDAPDWVPLAGLIHASALPALAGATLCSAAIFVLLFTIATQILSWKLRQGRT